jgi:predicted amidohydrolase YtcJ
MKALDIAAGIQPLSIQTDRDVAEALWGSRRCRDSYAWKSMEDAGLRLLFASDAPIEAIDPMAAMETAVTRRDFSNPSRDAWHPEQSLSVESALNGYFEHAGYLTGREDRSGKIEPGRLADLTVLDRSPFEVPGNRLRDLCVLMTIVDGEVVFEQR